jgi:hypothetical protein
MKKKENFNFFDSITLLSPTGQKASNLKEFLHILEESEDKVIFHHLYKPQMKSFQKMGEYPNDFANWAAYGLEDVAMAEKLANFDPYDFQKVSQAREKLVEIIEEHMWDLPNIPWVRPGSEFFFSSATSIVLPLDIEVCNIAELRDSMDILPDSSLYFHFYEERKRNKDKEHDDFSIWLENNFDDVGGLVEEIRKIDFYFFSLDEIRKKIVNILDKYLQGKK